MNVRIDDSPIHGRGVIANEVIREGHWQYLYGELRHVRPGDPFEKHVFEWDGDKHYMPFAPFCCLNHSETPNCEIGTYSEDPAVLYIEALREIEPNEELTIDYGYDPSED